MSSGRDGFCARGASRGKLRIAWPPLCDRLLSCAAQSDSVRIEQPILASAPVVEIPVPGSSFRLPPGWSADPDVLARPYDLFSQLQQHPAVHYDEDLAAWLVARAEDVKALLRHEALSAGAVGAFFERGTPTFRKEFAELERFFTSWMVFSDGQSHLRLRAFLAPLMTSAAVEECEAAIEAASIVRIPEDLPEGCDVLHDVIRPYAADSLANYLGVGLARFQEVHSWCDSLIGFIGTSSPTKPRAREANRALHGLRAFLAEEVAAIRRGAQRPPLLAAIATLPDVEAVATFAQLLTGSFEPVSSALGVVVHALASSEVQLQMVLNDEVAPGQLVDEILRFATPFRLAPRVAKNTICYGGVTMDRGERVLLLLAAANRDPAWFPNPHVFDLARLASSHLAFGHGVHRCLGFLFTRSLLLIALRRLAPALRGLRPVQAELELHPLLGATTPVSVVLTRAP